MSLERRYFSKANYWENKAKPTWIGLTDEEVRQMCGNSPIRIIIREIVRQAEAKLKEKNT